MTDQSIQRRKQIGSFLKESRTRVGLSQADVASAMSTPGETYHQTQIAKMERGERSVSLLEALSFMEAVHRPPHELLTAFDETPSGALVAIAAKLEKLGDQITELAEAYDGNELSPMLPVVQVSIDAGDDQDTTMRYGTTSSQSNTAVAALLRRASLVNTMHLSFLRSIVTGSPDPSEMADQLQKYVTDVSKNDD
ncbi:MULTISPECIES: helix-turn-helix domain-containing protein [unclassified Corynebacterium]|uniref:helix-turn-helix domain-containing protein n=1 Tax=unclassified Corynebacterium TaxID=2624378 RepID=UPI003F8FAB5B